MAKKERNTGAMPMEDRSWEAREDLRTLQRAAEISKDSKRVAAARTEAKKQIDALQSVTGKVDKAKTGSRNKRLSKVRL